MILLLFGLSAVSPAPGKDEQSRPDSKYFESTEVNIVNLDIFVTDKKGRPVHGLTLGDFEILEDGRPVEITNFSVLEDGRIRPAAAGQAEEGPAVGRRVLDDALQLTLFIDNRQLAIQDRRPVLKNLKRFLETRARPEDEITVISFDGDVNVRTRLTGSIEDINAAIDDIRKTVPMGTRARVEQQRLLRELQLGTLLQTEGNVAAMARGHAVEDAEAVLSGIRLYAQARYGESLQTIDALEELVGALAGVDGRKGLIYVGNGLSTRPGEALMLAWEAKYQDLAPGLTSTSVSQEMVRHDLTPRLRRMTEWANANRVTFYTVGALGLSPVVTNVELGMDPETLARRGGGITWTPQVDAAYKLSRTESLQRLAHSTGGIAATRAPNIGDLLEQVREDFSSYYSLGYRAGRTRDGEYHRIEVRLKDEKLRARHRDGYRDKTPEEHMKDRVRSALLVGATNNPLEVSVGFGDERSSDRKQTTVEVLISFSLGRLVLVPDDRFHRGQVTIFIAARDTHGRTSPVRALPVPIRIPNEEFFSALGREARYSLDLALRDGSNTVSVGVRDELGNVDSTTTATYPIDTPSGAPAL